MSDWNKERPVRLAIAVDDPMLSDRLALLLAHVHGNEVVQAGVDADAVLKAASRARAEVPFDPLTAREHEVLTLLAEGASNKEIAQRLGISAHTAKFHVRSVTDKVDATGRTDAVAQAARQRLIQL